MSNRHYKICSECQGKGSVERELRSRAMNSGGFAYIDIECPDCHGEGEVEVEDQFASPQLKSLQEIQSERDAEAA
jgi:DnaJ-class molecular chaperone